MFRYFLLATVLAHAPNALAADGPYCKDERTTRSPRCWLALDNSTDGRGIINIVHVDNASSLTNAAAADLVMVADRSTQNGDPSAAGRKGFMRNDDRVCVTDRYLAWFDYSVGDGTFYDPRVYGFEQTKSRAGALAGFWRIDPQTGTFIDKRN